MTRHQHSFANVEDYLHHRPPYLLVDEILEINDESIRTRSTVPHDAPHIAGHFPGAPILPGAMMQEMTTQSAGILIAANYNPMAEYDTHDPEFNEFALGVLTKVKFARFRGFARPGDVLNVQVQLETQLDSIFEFTAQILMNDATIMRNAFQLANIRSDVLRGIS